MVDLKPEHLLLLKDILHTYVPNEKVVAYGSRVKGNAWEYSDLDLCIMNEKPLIYTSVDDLKDILIRSRLPMLVDVIEWRKTSDDFKKVVAAQFEVIQEAGQFIPLEKPEGQGAHA